MNESDIIEETSILGWTVSTYNDGTQFETSIVGADGARTVPRIYDRPSWFGSMEETALAGHYQTVADVAMRILP